MENQKFSFNWRSSQTKPLDKYYLSVTIHPVNIRAYRDNCSSISSTIIMISTVTTSTISTITLAGSFALTGILVLFSLLIQKELATASDNEKLKKLGKVINIAIIPLLIVFILVVFNKVGTTLQ